MNHLHQSRAGAPGTATGAGAFPGLVGLTEPLTELVADAIAGVSVSLRRLRTRRRDKAQRRQTLDALGRLDDRTLDDIGFTRADLLDVSNRGLPLTELARRRRMHAPFLPSRLDVTVGSRRSAINDEGFNLAA